MIISLIVAMTANRVIGKDNDLPWTLPEDLKHFKRTTLGKPIIMGRKTYESIGRPLPGRRNMICSRNSEFMAEGCETFASLQDALEACEETEVMIIGGSSLFAEGLELADRLYLTEVHQEVEGDTYFPEFDRELWKEVERTDGERCSFVRLDRI